MHRLAAVIGLLALAITATPIMAAAPDEAKGPDVVLTADLEGVPIPLVAVANFQCNDFDYPAIHCFKAAGELSASLQVALSLDLLSGIDYVQVWEHSAYGGSSMVISQDYNALSLLGWNDRISSFKARNSQTGTFYTDWFANGSAYGFCCNQQVPSLGSYNDTFSSVYNN